MKARTKFSPVVITLETIEELDAFEKLVYMSSNDMNVDIRYRKFAIDLSNEMGELYNYEEDL